MEIRCVKGMCGLKVVRSEENLGFKGLMSTSINNSGETFTCARS